jgi:hypothetical protein
MQNILNIWILFFHSMKKERYITSTDKKKKMDKAYSTHKN